jgi:hypothetical protein
MGERLPSPRNSMKRRCVFRIHDKRRHEIPEIAMPTHDIGLTVAMRDGCSRSPTKSGRLGS